MTTSLSRENIADLPDDDEVDSLTIGRRIRRLRTDRGMTLEELAAAVDRAPSQLSMIENGRREPKLTLLQAIARALGSTLDALLESEPLDERSTLEIGLERAMRGQTFQALGIPALPHRQDRADRGAEGDAGAAGTRSSACATSAPPRRKRHAGRMSRCASSCARSTTTSPSSRSTHGGS